MHTCRPPEALNKHVCNTNTPTHQNTLKAKSYDKTNAYPCIFAHVRIRRIALNYNEIDTCVFNYLCNQKPRNPNVSKRLYKSFTRYGFCTRIDKHVYSHVSSFFVFSSRIICRKMKSRTDITIGKLVKKVKNERLILIVGMIDSLDYARSDVARRRNRRVDSRNISPQLPLFYVGIPNGALENVFLAHLSKCACFSQNTLRRGS